MNKADQERRAIELADSLSGIENAVRTLQRVKQLQRLSNDSKKKVQIALDSLYEVQENARNGCP